MIGWDDLWAYVRFTLQMVGLLSLLPVSFIAAGWLVGKVFGGGQTRENEADGHWEYRGCYVWVDKDGNVMDLKLDRPMTIEEIMESDDDD